MLFYTIFIFWSLPLLAVFNASTSFGIISKVVFSSNTWFNWASPILFMSWFCGSTHSNSILSMSDNFLTTSYKNIVRCWFKVWIIDKIGHKKILLLPEYAYRSIEEGIFKYMLLDYFGIPDKSSINLTHTICHIVIILLIYRTPPARRSNTKTVSLQIPLK